MADTDKALTKQQLNLIWERAEEEYRASGSTLGVVELLQAYSSHAPNHSLAWFRLGDSLREIGQLVCAEEALLKARQSAPTENLWSVDARLGMLYERKGSRKRAEMAYRRATAQKTCAGWVWILRGINLFSLEQVEDARICFSRALNSDDVDKDEAYVNLGLVARHNGDYVEAVRCAKAALEIDPSFAAARELITSIESGIKARDFLRSLD